MANQTEIFSPEMEIINHFDQLINRVDIDIEKSLKNHSQDQNLADLDIKSRNTICLKPLQFRYFDSFKSSVEKKEESVELWPESTKVVDYLKQVRMRTIEELRKEQEDKSKNSST